MDSKKIVLITGANGGLGYQIVRAICNSDQAYEIFVGGRSLTRAQQAAKSVLEEYPSTKSNAWAVQVDIEDDDSIQGAFQEIESKMGRLDILVNNAGGQFDQQYANGGMTMRQMWNLSWSTNTTGTQIMTHTFVPLLLKSKDPRLLFITSGTSGLVETENLKLPFNTPPSKGWPKPPGNSFTGIPAYRASKCGMNMMMRQWVQVLREDGVKIWCVSPGFLATGLGAGAETTKAMGAADPSIGGEFVKSVIEGARDGDVGKVIRKDNIQPW